MKPEKHGETGADLRRTKCNPQLLDGTVTQVTKHYIHTNKHTARLVSTTVDGNPELRHLGMCGANRPRPLPQDPSVETLHKSSNDL